MHVDDDPDQLLFTKVILEDIDPRIRVESRSSPAEVDILELDSFDCLISDYQMPVMDGVHLARRVQKRSDIPIIKYTEKRREELADEALRAGVDDYVEKKADPHHYLRLHSSVLEVVGRRLTEIVARIIG